MNKPIYCTGDCEDCWWPCDEYDDESEHEQEMTIGQARKEIPDIDSFCAQVCNECQSNDWYCTGYCESLEKARKMDYERILKAYVRHEGDLNGVIKYIKRARV